MRCSLRPLISSVVVPHEIAVGKVGVELITEGYRNKKGNQQDLNAS